MSPSNWNSSAETRSYHFVGRFPDERAGPNSRDSPDKDGGFSLYKLLVLLGLMEEMPTNNKDWFRRSTFSSLRCVRATHVRHRPPVACSTNTRRRCILTVKE
jgi:hypothetical protein